MTIKDKYQKLYSHNNVYLDPVRNKTITGSPEEIVRQKVLFLLINHLGYPSHLIAIEKKLEKLLCDKNSFSVKIPDRRLDILVCAPFSHRLRHLSRNEGIQPLLILECKAGTLNNHALFQLIGYNTFLNAPCVGLVNDKESLLGILNIKTNKYEVMHNFLSFDHLKRLYCIT